MERDEGLEHVRLSAFRSFRPFRAATPVILCSVEILPEERERKEVRRTKERVGLDAMRSRATASGETIRCLIPRVFSRFLGPGHLEVSIKPNHENDQNEPYILHAYMFDV